MSDEHAAERPVAAPPLDLAAAVRSIPPRVAVRIGFLGVFIFSCVQLWRHYQWALGAGPHVSRPEATAGLVPLGALMSLAAWIKSGIFDPVMPASVVIIIAAVLVSVLLKRGFCGWICPVGSVTGAFGWVGRRFTKGQRPRRMPRVLDIVLRVPKYVAAAFLLGWVFMMPAQIALEFQLIPYYATSDLKILYGLLHPAWGYWALAGFVAVTTLATGTNTWCRYLCPLGAIYGGLSFASLGVVKRNPERCVDCKACDRACVARIGVSTSAAAIRDPECDGCQDCTRACPAPGALTVRLGGGRLPWQFWPVLLLTAWLLVWAFSVATGHWQQGLPDEVIAQYMQTMKLTHDF